MTLFHRTLGRVITSANPTAIPIPEAGGPSQANQAALEAETNEDTYAPPDLIKHSPGVCKAWIQFEQIGTQSILASYNITSIADGGANGRTDVTIATDFSSAAYAVVGGAGKGGDTDARMVMAPGGGAVAAGVVDIQCRDEGGTLVDVQYVSLAMFGDQA